MQGQEEYMDCRQLNLEKQALKARKIAYTSARRVLISITSSHKVFAADCTSTC